MCIKAIFDKKIGILYNYVIYDIENYESKCVVFVFHFRVPL